MAGRILLAASVVAVGLHLYGLYRPAGPPTPSWPPEADKLEHLVGFGVPVLLVLLSLSWYGVGGVGRRAERITVVLFAVHAVVSELAQLFWYTHRTGDPFDVLADWTGVALGWWTYRLIRRTRPERS